MSIYSIAGLKVKMNPSGEILKKQGEPYLLYKSDGYGIARAENNNGESDFDIEIKVSRDFLLKKQYENPHLTYDECEYIWYGAQFYSEIIDFDGLLIHSSAVEVDGDAYLFTAPCGTGKSTHTALYLEHFGKRARIINDDKPAVILKNGIFYACGTPFSGKVDMSVNTMVPIKGLCIVARGQDNIISKADRKEALITVMNQTVRPKTLAKADKFLHLLDILLKDVPIYKLFCNISDDAVCVSYGAMSGKEA